MEEKKLKVLMLTDDFEPIYGGVSTVVKYSSLALSKFADVTIGTVMPPKKIRDKIDDPVEYKVYRCKGKYNHITTNMSANLSDKAFIENIESEKYDIIHCHFPLKLYKYGLKLGKKCNIPVVITAHSIFYPDFKDVIKSKLLTKLAIRIVLKRYNRADKTFCVTKFEKNFLEKFGLKNSIVLNNAVKMPAYKSTNDEYLSNVKSQCNIKSDDFVITSVGRLVKMKNILFSVHAFAELHKKYPNTKYLIVGDGAERNKIEILINKLNLQDCCFLLGAIIDKTKLATIFELADAISFMSKGDSCGLIQYEGAYYEKPTIALANTAISDCLDDMKNGIVIHGSQDSMQIAKSIDKVAICDYVNKVGKLIEDRQLCVQIGKNAKKEIYREYDDNYAKELLSLYQQIITDFHKKHNTK